MITVGWFGSEQKKKNLRKMQRSKMLSLSHCLFDINNFTPKCIKVLPTKMHSGCWRMSYFNSKAIVFMRKMSQLCKLACYLHRFWVMIQRKIASLLFCSETSHNIRHF